MVVAAMLMKSEACQVIQAGFHAEDDKWVDLLRLMGRWYEKLCTHMFEVGSSWNNIAIVATLVLGAGSQFVHLDTALLVCMK